jgi:hypothetical protein
VAVYEDGGSIELRPPMGTPGSGKSDNGASAARFLGIARAVLRTLPKG